MDNSLFLLREWFFSPVVCGSFVIVGVTAILASLFFCLCSIFADRDMPRLFCVFFSLGLLVITVGIISLFSFNGFFN